MSPKAKQRARQGSPKRDFSLLYRVDRLPGATKADRRRKEILEAVIEIIGEAGVHELTAQAVCQRSGLARSHVVYYYPKIEDLIVGAIEHVIHYGQVVSVQFLAGAHTPQDSLEKYLEGTWHWLFRLETAHAAVISLLHALGGTKKEPYHTLNRVLRERSVERFYEIFRAMKPQAKSAKLRAAAMTAREVLVGAVTAQYTIDPSGPTGPTEKRVQRAILDLLEACE